MCSLPAGEPSGHARLSVGESLPGPGGRDGQGARQHGGEVPAEVRGDGQGQGQDAPRQDCTGGEPFYCGFLNNLILVVNGKR